MRRLKRFGGAWRESRLNAMNKAFVKEPEDNGERNCPRCGSLGLPVASETLQAQLVAEAVGQISSSAFFCPLASCEVAYFDPYDRVATTAQLQRPVWPKDPEAPICACFSLTRDDVEADLAEGTVERTRQVVERAKSPEARCTLRAASGRSCVAEVQRYYMKRRGELQG